jgi:hypothetical protein
MPASSQPVKKSASNDCYPSTAADYSKITTFTPYNTLDECLKSGGRLVVHQSSVPQPKAQKAPSPATGPIGSSMPRQQPTETPDRSNR